MITMGCGDACPIYPGKRYEDWVLDDPAGQGIDAVQPIRDDRSSGGGSDRRTRALGLHGICQRDRVERRCSVGVIVKYTNTSQRGVRPLSNPLRPDADQVGPIGPEVQPVWSMQSHVESPPSRHRTGEAAFVSASTRATPCSPGNM